MKPEGPTVRNLLLGFLFIINCFVYFKIPIYTPQNLILIKVNEILQLELQVTSMIYLIDSSEYKIIFDKNNNDKPYALPKSEYEKLGKLQEEFIFKGEYPENAEVDVYVFEPTNCKLKGKDCMIINTKQTQQFDLNNLLWKVIEDEDQEGDQRYVEIL